MLGLLVSLSVAAEPVSDAKQHAQIIQDRLLEQLYTFPLEQQGEWALMLWRTTGNNVFLNTARVSLLLSAERLQGLAASMKQASERRDMLVKEGFSTSPALFEKFTDYFFYGFLVLPELLKIDQFSMALKGGIGAKTNRNMSALDFKPALTNIDMIHRHGPELATQVYALLNFDYGDFRKSFIDAFHAVYPEKKDKKLSPEQRVQKWLTMSNLVLAASHQLQEPVTDALLAWIPEYFIRHQTKILKEGDDVLLAKIGLVLLLTGNDQGSLLADLRDRAFKRPLPETIGETDVWNMLLLGWIENYYPDPALYRMTRFNQKLPYILKPRDEDILAP